MVFLFNRQHLSHDPPAPVTLDSAAFDVKGEFSPRLLASSPPRLLASSPPRPPSTLLIGIG